MRDLNLGPTSRKVIEQYQRDCRREAPDFHPPAVESLEATCKVMADLLQRWIDVAWCWPDAAPARICGGPHVRVKYQHDRMGQEPRPIEIIEPADKVGETFPDVPYTIIKS